MAHQSLYRRYRPQRFTEVKGQDHLVAALQNAVREGRVGHAYLFSGPRGTGKTTTARIIAKAMNCPNVVDGEPCGVCDSCRSIESGSSFDVHELDAASNNGVDAIRDLVEKASLGTPGRHKVYILDEVHMLSKAAEAALLKTLEEPPPHVVFVLATTDPQKMSDTIRSRTQHLQFHLLPTDTLTEHVQWVAHDAGLELSQAAIDAAIVQGGGSARDTLSALELLANTGGDVSDVVDLDEFLIALAERDAGVTRESLATELFSERFLSQRPLLQAIDPKRAVRPVLLIDELDRADEPFEAFLLEVLAEFQITIPELGTVKAKEPPIVVLTSNRTREIHDAVKRRCLYHWTGFPSAARELEIVRRRVPDAGAELARQVVAFVQKLRGVELYKLPGIAETIDWTRALLELDAVVLDPEVIQHTLGVLLKYQDDIAAVQGSEALRLLEEARRIAADRVA